MDDPRNSDVETEIWSQTESDEPVESNEGNRGEFIKKIAEFLGLYWQRRRLAIGIIVVGIALAIGYSFTIPPYFTSTTSLMPQDNESPYTSLLGMAAGSSAAASIGTEAFGLSTPSELQISILESRTVRNAMIAKFGLMQHYGVGIIDQARGTLSDNTKIDEDRKSGIITIAVTDTNADFAAKLAQGYVSELNRVLTDNSTSAARRERIFLEERLKEVKRNLDLDSVALSQFSTKTKAIDVVSQAKSMVEAGLRLQGLLAEGQSQLAALRQTYSEDNYRVKALEARNAELQHQLDAMGGTDGKSGSSSSMSFYPPVGELPTLGVTFADLDRRVKVDEVLWETLTRQYESARVQEAKEIPTIQVLDQANVPNRKSGPKRRVIVLTGALISLLLSFVVVFCIVGWQKLDSESLPKKIASRWTRKAQAVQS
jgi:Capsule polysaccharide export protein